MKSERGSATLLVLTMLAVLGVLLVSNAMVLHHLRAELRRVERQQEQKFVR